MARKKNVLQLDIFAPQYLYLAQCINAPILVMHHMTAGGITTANEQFQLYKFVQHLYN